MYCPKCSGKTKVWDSRESFMDARKYGVEENLIMRRRKCPDCDYRFITFEIPAAWFLDMLDEVYGEEGEES